MKQLLLISILFLGISCKKEIVTDSIQLTGEKYNTSIGGYLHPTQIGGSYNTPVGEKAKLPIAELIVFQGESNAGGLGRNDLATTQQLSPQKRIMILNNNTFQFEHLDIGYNNNLKTLLNPLTYHGWELGLSEIVSSPNNPFCSNNVYVVKMAKSGSMIWHWVGDWIYYWNEGKAFLRAAINELNAKGIPYRITVWQSIGINDKVQAYPIDQWKAKMRAFRTQFRNEFGADIPFIATKFPSQIMPQIWNDAIDELGATDIPVGQSINAEGAATYPDHIHWNYEGLKTQATSFVEKMIGMGRGCREIKKDSSIALGVDAIKRSSWHESAITTTQLKGLNLGKGYVLMDK